MRESHSRWYDRERSLKLAATEPEWSTGDRIWKALRHAQKRHADLAAELGVSDNTLGNWIAGRNQPSQTDLEAIARRCDVPYEWLAGDTPKVKRGTTASRHLAAGRRRFTDNKKYGDSPLNTRPETHSYRRFRHPKPESFLRETACVTAASTIRPTLRGRTRAAAGEMGVAR